MACFHCECKRPADTFVDNEKQEKQHVHPSRLEKISNRQEVSNAWNFDFDDDESDGADVAAFEYADSSVAREGSLDDNQERGNKFSRDVMGNEYSNTGNRRPDVGFDDFVDEEDDIDSYELDTSMNKPHSIEFSDIEGHSGLEDFNGSDRRPGFAANGKHSKTSRRKAAFSESEDDELDFDSDEDSSVKRDWKSSHLAGSRQRSRGDSLTARSRRLSYGSDELGLDSDVDEDFEKMSGSRPGKGKMLGSSRKPFQTRSRSSTEGGPSSGSDSDDSDGRSRRHGSRGNKRENYRRGSDSKAHGNKYVHERGFQSNNFRNGRKNAFHDDFDKVHERGFQSNNFRNGRKNAFHDDFDNAHERGFQSNNFRNGRKNVFHDDFDKSSRGSRGTNHRFNGNDRDRRGSYSSGSDKRDSWGSKGSRKQRPGRYNEYGAGMHKDYGEFRNSRRVIER